MELHLIGAWLAIGLAALGVWLGTWMLAKKLVEVMGKNPDMAGQFRLTGILGLALVESAAIYALVVAFSIINGGADISWYAAIGAWLAIGIAGFGASVGESMLVSGTLDAILRNPSSKWILTQTMVLFVALVEAAAIYGLVVALQILG